jgi:hypothetical protein
MIPLRALERRVPFGPNYAVDWLPDEARLEELLDRTRHEEQREVYALWGAHGAEHLRKNWTWDRGAVQAIDSLREMGWLGAEEAEKPVEAEA